MPYKYFTLEATNVTVDVKKKKENLERFTRDVNFYKKWYILSLRNKIPKNELISVSETIHVNRFLNKQETSDKWFCLQYQMKEYDPWTLPKQ